MPTYADTRRQFREALKKPRFPVEFEGYSAFG